MAIPIFQKSVEVEEIFHATGVLGSGVRTWRSSAKYCVLRLGRVGELQLHRVDGCVATATLALLGFFSFAVCDACFDAV